MELEYYNFFGLSKESSYEDINIKYSQLKKKYQNTDKFVKFNKIYKILSNIHSRNDYDCYGENLPKFNKSKDAYEIYFSISLEQFYINNPIEFNLNSYIIDENDKIIYNIKKEFININIINPVQISLPNKKYLIYFDLLEHSLYKLEKNNLIINLDIPLIQSLTKSFIFKCMYIDEKTEIIIQPDFIIKPDDVYFIKNKGYGR